MNIEYWKIWYTENRCFEAKGTLEELKQKWIDLPDDGFLAGIIYFDEYANNQIQYKRILSGHDWYFWWNDTILENNNTDNEERYPGCIIKRGKWATEEEFYAALNDVKPQKKSVCKDCN